MLKIKLLATALLVSTFIFAQQNRKSFSLPAMVTSADYQPNTVIIKVKPGYRYACTKTQISTPQLTSVFKKTGTYSVNKLFALHTPPTTERNANGNKLTDLSLVYELKYAGNSSIEKVINQLLATGEIEYAEPSYIYQPLYTPSDTLVGYQYHHTNIRSYQAWDIQKGDPNVVIGITDTGVDTTHIELVNKFKYNTADPINGIDDDADGYTDNYYGWNVAFNDNNVAGPALLHGNFVTGIAAAETDNITGIAGVGFNCKFLAIRCAPNANVIVNGDVAIVYAADHNCFVINCSWGGFGSSQFSQDVINYATFNKGCLVVGAAGNSNNDAPFFPASYQYVLSVAGIDSVDVKWSGSSYGTYVDVCAAGDKVYSIFPMGSPNLYWYSGGTSEAAPQVSGAAALVKSQFPALTGLQVGERLRVTSDVVDTLPGNASYVGKLGKGRINIFRALTEPATALRAYDITITDNNDEAFVGNDTLDISAVFTNVLDPVAGLSISLSASSPLINILNPNLSFPSLATMQSDSNRANPFKCVIDPTIPLNTKIIFTLTYSAGTYSDFQKFEVTVNVDYLNVLVNDVGLSITSKGRLGFNDTGNAQGIGFTYNEGANLIYSASFVVGVNDSMVSDATEGATGINNDFVPVNYIQKIIPSVNSDFDAVTTFNDAAATLPTGLVVRQNNYAWSTPADRKYVIEEYTITNNSANNYPALYAAVFSDWDITAATYNDNRASYDAALKMGYAWYTVNNNSYAGIKLLTGGGSNYYAFNNDGSAGSVNIYDGLTKAEKYQCMSTLTRNDAGTTGNGTDIAMMMTTGPFNLNAGDSIKVAFAIIGGDSLADLTNAATAAQIKYNTVGVTEINSSDGVKVFPNPAKGYFTISFHSSIAQRITATLYDHTGKKTTSLTQHAAAGTTQVHINTQSINPGIYSLQVKMKNNIHTKKIVVY